MQVISLYNVWKKIEKDKHWVAPIIRQNKQVMCRLQKYKKIYIKNQKKRRKRFLLINQTNDQFLVRTLIMSSWGLGGGGWVGICIGWVDSLSGRVSFLFRLRGLRDFRMLTTMPENTMTPAVLATALSLELAARGSDIAVSESVDWGLRLGGLLGFRHTPLC